MISDRHNVMFSKPAAEQLALGLPERESRCLTCRCKANEKDDCDFTCMANPKLYVDRLREVEGWKGHAWPMFRSTRDVAYPRYIPLLHPRRSYPDLSDLNAVAVTLYDLFHLTPDRSSCELNYESGGDLRSAMSCRSDCRILLSGVVADDRLELFWKFLEKDHLARRISELGVDAVTLPNFSFFIPMPSDHFLYNIRRMQIVASLFADAGIAVIPHLNATTDEHWQMWTELLANQPNITHICKEFQTGHSVRDNAEHAASQLITLQKSIGRRISVVMIAGRQHLDLFARRFANVTLVDSQVTMKSAKYQKCTLKQDGRMQWARHQAPQRESIKALFRHNLTIYAETVAQALSADAVPLQRWLRGLHAA
jgi:hypothetical protein